MRVVRYGRFFVSLANPVWLSRSVLNSADALRRNLCAMLLRMLSRYQMITMHRRWFRLSCCNFPQTLARAYRHGPSGPRAACAPKKTALRGANPQFWLQAFDNGALTGLRFRCILLSNATELA